MDDLTCQLSQLETDNSTLQNANEYYQNTIYGLGLDIDLLRQKIEEINLEKEAYKRKYHTANEMYNGKASALVVETERLQSSLDQEILKNKSL